MTFPLHKESSSPNFSISSSLKIRTINNSSNDTNQVSMYFTCCIVKCWNTGKKCEKQKLQIIIMKKSLSVFCCCSCPSFFLVDELQVVGSNPIWDTKKFHMYVCTYVVIIIVLFIDHEEGIQKMVSIAAAFSFSVFDFRVELVENGGSFSRKIKIILKI